MIYWQVGKRLQNTRTSPAWEWTLSAIWSEHFDAWGTRANKVIKYQSSKDSFNSFLFWLRWFVPCSIHNYSSYPLENTSPGKKRFLSGIDQINSPLTLFWARCSFFPRRQKRLFYSAYYREPSNQDDCDYNFVLLMIWVLRKVYT